jgi:hypothetical protein
MGDWAYNIFLMIAMKLLIGGEQPSEATNDRVMKHAMRHFNSCSRKHGWSLEHNNDNSKGTLTALTLHFEYGF